jgi:hypothetical protein
MVPRGCGLDSGWDFGAERSLDTEVLLAVDVE